MDPRIASASCPRAEGLREFSTALQNRSAVMDEMDGRSFQVKPLNRSLSFSSPVFIGPVIIRPNSKAMTGVQRN